MLAGAAVCVLPSQYGTRHRSLCRLEVEDGETRYCWRRDFADRACSLALRSACWSSRRFGSRCCVLLPSRLFGSARGTLTGLSKIGLIRLSVAFD